MFLIEAASNTLKTCYLVIGMGLALLCCLLFSIMNPRFSISVPDITRSFFLRRVDTKSPISSRSGQYGYGWRTPCIEYAFLKFLKNYVVYWLTQWFQIRFYSHFISDPGHAAKNYHALSWCPGPQRVWRWRSGLCIQPKTRSKTGSFLQVNIINCAYRSDSFFPSLILAQFSLWKNSRLIQVYNIKWRLAQHFILLEDYAKLLFWFLNLLERYYMGQGKNSSDFVGRSIK